jgi:hypothetical protein
VLRREDEVKGFLRTLPQRLLCSSALRRDDAGNFGRTRSRPFLVGGFGAVIGRSVCQPISAVAYSALVPNRQDAITGKKGEQVSVRVIGASGTYHSPDTCGIHLGCKLFTAFELDQVVGRQHLSQSSALAIFRVQSNASARRAASTRVRPISKELESVWPQPARLFQQVRASHRRIRSPNRSTGSSSKTSIAIAGEA